MIFQVKDNSGALEARLIKILENKRGSIGDWIVVSILKTQSQSQLKKGSLSKGLIIRTKKGLKRKDGTLLKFDENSIVLVNDQRVPLGSRITGPLPLEICRIPKMSHLTTSFI